MERFFTGRELVNTSSRLERNAALGPMSHLRQSRATLTRDKIAGVTSVLEPGLTHMQLLIIPGILTSDFVTSIIFVLTARRHANAVI